MAAGSEPDRWVGRSGRIYVLEPDAGARDGGMASIRRVLPQSPPNAVSTVPEGTVLALKLARVDDKLAEEALAREVESFVALSRAPGSPPCPRLYDIIGNPVTGIVMEWCPTDMERWWEATWQEPRSFADLCEALADVCRRVREYEAVAELELGKRVIHADIKPRNVLRAADGRWLLTDFGASKSRSVEDTQWAATRMILGTENFIAPEALFNARKPHPAAMDTWSIGCTFFALLRMRTVLRGGGRMPPNGTHAHPFRTQRVALVGDLQQRKPALFVDKDLDPAQFPSPEKLPEKDRRAVAEALEGVFGKPSATLEGVLATESLNLLDRALRVNPALRFRDPLEMAGEFEALAQRFRELALRADGFGSGRVAGEASAPVEARSAPGVEARAPIAEAAGPTGPRASSPRSGSAPDASGKQGASGRQDASGKQGASGRQDASGKQGASGRKETPQAGASAPRVLVGEDIVVDEGSGRRGAAPAAAKVPPWIGIALLAVLGLQVVQIGVSTAALVVALDAPEPVVVTAPAPVAASPAPAPPLAALVEAPPAAVPAGAAAEVAPVAVDPPATEAPAASAPAARSAPAPAVPKRVGTPPSTPTSASGLVLVSGAQAYLVGPSGRMPVGSVAAGSYELFVQTRSDGDFESQGTVRVEGGDRIVYKCGLGTCRRSP